LDITKPLCARGFKVAVGDFHATGVMLILKEHGSYIEKTF